MPPKDGSSELKATHCFEAPSEGSRSIIAASGLVVDCDVALLLVDGRVMDISSQVHRDNVVPV